MGVLEVKKYLSLYNKEEDIIFLDKNSATVEEAAKALDIEPGMVAKSLTFMLKDEVIMIVTKGTSKIDNSKYKHFFNIKAKMLTADEIDKYIGHKIGGICPFALDDSVKVYLDISLKDYNFVFPACGDNHTAIKLSIKELEELSHYTAWIDVCK